VVLTINAGLARNIGTGPDNSTNAYQRSRCIQFLPATGACVVGAETDWTALRFGADLTCFLADGWEFRGRFGDSLRVIS
jgi:hypothetical protein